MQTYTRIITTLKHLRSSVWKDFKSNITNKDQAVCKKQLSYSTTTTNLRTQQLVYHTSEAAEASD